MPDICHITNMPAYADAPAGTSQIVEDVSLAGLAPNTKRYISVHCNSPFFAPVLPGLAARPGLLLVNIVFVGQDLLGCVEVF